MQALYGAQLSIKPNKRNGGNLTTIYQRQFPAENFIGKISREIQPNIQHKIL